eukprot:m51a1_g12316 putative gata-binding transcription factor (163) ;mRNA; r:411672-412387
MLAYPAPPPAAAGPAELYWSPCPGGAYPVRAVVPSAFMCAPPSAQAMPVPALLPRAPAQQLQQQRAAVCPPSPMMQSIPQTPQALPATPKPAKPVKPVHRRRPANMDKSKLFCHMCGRRDTPEWRKGPAGPATLCNACGLQWCKKQKEAAEAAASQGDAMVI